MQFPTLQSDLGIRRGDGLSSFGKKFPLADGLKQDLQGYHAVCLVKDMRRGQNYICAIPDKGGDYAIIGRVYDRQDKNDMQTEDGLRRLMNR